MSEKILFDEKMPIKIAIFSQKISSLLLIYGILFGYLKHKVTHIKITENQIIYTTGLFTRTIENIDIYRILDISIKQEFFAQIFKFGILRIRSSDKNTPYFELLMNNPIEWRERLLSLMQEERKKKNYTINEIIN